MDKQNNNEDIFFIIKEEFPISEFEEIEYKAAQVDFPKEFWKTYSAYANTNTGLIVLGVREKGASIVFEGLTDQQIESYKKRFWNDCNNPKTVSINLLTNEDVRVVTHQNKKLLVFKIPVASRTQKPVYLTKNPFGNTYKRNNEGDYRCTDEEVKRMIADASAELKKDAVILENYTLDDIDTTSLKQYKRLFSIHRPGHPWLVENNLELLKKLGAYRIDRQTRKEGLTIAGLLMFGKYESISEILPNFFPDFREKQTADKNIRWTDRIYPDGTWEANLFQFYIKVWAKLSLFLPKPFKLQGDTRIDETPTHIALREAFINALVHTDYSLSGNIVIAVDNEKFVFSNPGTLLVSMEQYYTGGVSECRNPALQQMFLLIGKAEKAGSGVDKILAGWEERHWRKPYLNMNNSPDKVVLTLYRLIQENGDPFDEKITILREKVATYNTKKSMLNKKVDTFGEKNVNLGEKVESFEKKNTNLGEKVATFEGKNANLGKKVETFEKKNTRLGKKVGTFGEKNTNLGEKVATFEKKNANLCEEVESFGEKNTDSGEKVETSGEKNINLGEKVETFEKKNTHLGEKVDTFWEKNTHLGEKVDTFDEENTNLGEKVATFEKKNANLGKKVETFEKKNADLGEKVDTSDETNLKEKVTVSKNLKRNELENLIMFICKDEYIRMDEVAVEIGRSVNYLKNKVFPIMIKKGKLEKKYPNTNNHPKQAYKTVSHN